MKFLTGFICGVVFSTIGASGVVSLIDKFIHLIQHIAHSLV